MIEILSQMYMHHVDVWWFMEWTHTRYMHT